MKRINNYIKYLPFLILFGGINVYAQTEGGPLFPQASEQLSKFFSSFTSSNMQGFLFNYALPFLFVFGLLSYLAWHSKHELNRPLLLIFFIIAIFTTVYFHEVLTSLVLVFGIIFLIIALHRLFHSIVGSLIGLLIVIAIFFFGINGIIAFLSSISGFIFAFILFIIFVILGAKAHRTLKSSEDIKTLAKDVKYLYYKMRKPQDVKGLKGEINKLVTDFKNENKDFFNMVEKLNSLINKKELKAEDIKEIETLAKNIKDNYQHFNTYYNEVKKAIDNYEKHIGEYYTEPLKSELLKFLKNSEKEIDHFAQTIHAEYIKFQHKENTIRAILNRKK